MKSLKIVWTLVTLASVAYANYVNLMDLYHLVNDITKPIVNRLKK
jgi:uncharacterized membrane protein